MRAQIRIKSHQPEIYQTGLCYMDPNRVQEAKSMGEYVQRITMGIRDKEEEGHKPVLCG